MKHELLKINGPVIKEIDFNVLEQETSIDLDEEIEYPPSALSLGYYSYGNKSYPIPIATYGNLSCISGVPKTKKSFLKSLFVASFIENSSFAEKILTHRELPYLILDFDTEQSKFDCQRTFKRVERINGFRYDNYMPFYLRELSVEERINLIDYLVNKYKKNIGLICIDGVADLIHDVNNLEKANELTHKILKWSSTTNAHIITVLHSNFGSDKLTGHLGSVITKKAETVLSLKREGNVTETSVEFINTRSRKPDDFKFVIEGGLPKIIWDNVKELKLS